MLRRCCLAWTLVLLAARLCWPQEDGGSSKAARIGEMVAQYERYGYLNGPVLVAEHGRVIYARGVGYARMESHSPNTTRTRFDIASITKQFTAVLVLQQVEEGRMRLNDKLSAYLSWYRKDTGDRITIEQLLHHTSGLPPDFDTPEFSQSIEASRHYEPEAFAEKFCQQGLVSEPGTKWNYSNCGYILVGLILERATRESFGDLLRTRLLEPLGMKDSGMDRNDLLRSGGASGYLRHAGPRYTLGPPFDSDHGFSAGAMYSTVEDLFRWNQALSANAPFSPEIREQIFRAGLNNWAYGWFVSKIPAGTPGAGSTLAEMRGDLPGNYFAWLLRYPEQDNVIIVLRNVYGSTEHLEENIQAILFDQEPRVPRRSVKDLAAAAWLRPTKWIASNRTLSALILLLAAGSIWLAVRTRKRTG